MEEEVQWLIKPPASMPVPVHLAAKGVPTRTLIEKVGEEVGGPAAVAGELVLEDVWVEAAGVVRHKGMAHGKA